LFTDSDYWYSVGLSFFLAFAIIFFSLSLSLLIATMAYQPIKGARIYRTLLIWPYALSPVIAGIIFQLMFNNTAGILNYMLESTFGFKVQWLLNPNIAPWTIVATSVWNIMGFNILFYIAGLQNVPNDLLEAAAIDGANVFQRFFRVTFPMLAPITFFLVVTNTTYAFFDTFGLIDFLTGGGPVNSTSTLMYEVFVVGVENRNLGAAAAQSLILFLIVIGVTIIQFRASEERITYGA
jgi:sn-glycerol 3-phosphate transport system permease protein